MRAHFCCCVPNVRLVRILVYVRQLFSLVSAGTSTVHSVSSSVCTPVITTKICLLSTPIATTVTPSGGGGQVAGFDWTPPRQVAVAELKRPTRSSAASTTGGNDGGGKNPGEEGGGGGGGGRGGASQQHGPGISVQSVPCRNMSNQTLYLSVEAASVRVRGERRRVFVFVVGAVPPSVGAAWSGFEPGVSRLVVLVLLLVGVVVVVVVAVPLTVPLLVVLVLLLVGGVVVNGVVCYSSGVTFFEI